MLEVGWTEVPGARWSLLALRPGRALEHAGRVSFEPGPQQPIIVSAYVSGERARAEVRDLLAHACGRHGVTFSESDDATGTAPPGSRYRRDGA